MKDSDTCISILWLYCVFLVRFLVQRDVVGLSSMQPDLDGVPYQSMIPSGATGIGMGVSNLDIC